MPRDQRGLFHLTLATSATGLVIASHGAARADTITVADGCTLGQAILSANDDFGYPTTVVEPPQRDDYGAIVKDKKGKPVADASLRDTEDVPLTDDIDAYFRREVLPHVADAWLDKSKTKVGYEIPFNRYFYEYAPPRPLETIDDELQQLGREIMELLTEVVA